jgi:hypothetical protein
MYCVLYVSLHSKKVSEISTCFARDKKESYSEGARERQVSLSMMVWKKIEGAVFYVS